MIRSYHFVSKSLSLWRIALHFRANPALLKKITSVRKVLELMSDREFKNRTDVNEVTKNKLLFIQCMRTWETGLKWVTPGDESKVSHNSLHSERHGEAVGDWPEKGESQTFQSCFIFFKKGSTCQIPFLGSLDQMAVDWKRAGRFPSLPGELPETGILWFCTLYSVFSFSVFCILYSVFYDSVKRSEF